MSYQIQVPVLTPFNKLFLIVTGSLYLLMSVLTLFGVPALGLFGLRADAFVNGHIYQIFTYVFAAQGPSGLIQFLFSALIIWFIGSDLEVKWGRKTYQNFFLAAGLGAGVSFVIIVWAFFSNTAIYSMPLYGLNSITYALLLAYGLIYTDRYLTFLLIFPMKAKYFCFLLMGIEVYMAFFSAYGKASWGHLGGMLFGFLYLRYKASSIQKNRSKLEVFKKKPKKKSPNLYVVKDEDDQGPTFH